MRLVRALGPRAVLALAVLAACGEPEALGPATTSIDLEWAGEAAPPIQVLGTLPIPAELDGWTILATRPTVEVEGEVRSLRLGRDQDPRAIVPVPDGLLASDLVVVDVAAEAPLRLRLGIGRIDAELGPRMRWSEEVATIGHGQRKRAEFEIAPVDGDTHLVVHAHFKSQGRFVLHGFEFRAAPAERRIAAIDEPARWISVAGEARPAHALAEGRDARSRFSVGPRSELVLSAAPDPNSSAESQGFVTVRLVSSERDRTVARIPLQSREPAWTDARVDLSDWVGEEVRLELAVEGARLALVTSPELVVPRAQPPTVLLISSDTHRADHVGRAPGAAPITTPALDRLAEQGVFFERAFASSNITLPSHATLLTGLNPRDTGVIDNMTLIGERAVTLAERFKEAGWVTYGAVSACHLAPRTSGFEQGFDRYAWPEDIERTGGSTIAGLRGWLDDAEGRPLFLFLHVFDAHRPYEASEEVARASYPGADPFDTSLPEPGVPLLKEGGRTRDPEWIRALYRAQIDELDAQLAALLEHPRLANAVVAFTADHGENLGDQGLWWDHMGAFPAVLRVPLILRWPGGPRGARVARTVAQADLGRTLLAMAEIPPRDFPGDDLRAWLEPEPPERLRFVIAGAAHAYAVTDENWHLTITLHNGADKHLVTRDHAAEFPVQLFDLDRDPSCLEDRSADEPERVARMGRELLSWLAAPRASLAAEDEASADTLALLAELGYASGEAGAGGLSRVDPERVRAALAPWLSE